MLKNFAHPNPRAQGGKRAMPLLFEKFPEAKDAIERFAVKKLATLTIEAVHDFVHTELVPKLFEIWRTDERLVNQGESDEEFITPAVVSLFPAKKGEKSSRNLSGNALVLSTCQSRGFVRMQQGRELTLALTIISP